MTQLNIWRGGIATNFDAFLLDLFDSLHPNDSVFLTFFVVLD